MSNFNSHKFTNLPNYSYLAKNLAGAPKTGIIDAKDKQELANILHQEGYVLISSELNEKKKFLGGMSFNIPFFSKNKISFAEKIMFTRNLRVIVSAGISLPKSLATLSDQTRSKNFKKVLLNVAEEVNKGKSFSESLAMYPAVFNELFVSMVKVGEEAGTLEQSLDVVASQMEKSYDLQGKIKGAMIYPVVIISVMLVIGIIMLILVVPQLSKTFQELGIELPVTTQIVIFVGNFTARYWYTLPFFFLFIFFVFRSVIKSKSGRKYLDRTFLKTPFLSSLVKKTNSAYTVRTLGSLISAGVPLIRSLEITSDTLNNFYYKEAISKAAEEIKKGTKLSQFLSAFQNIYPPLVIQMLAVGEETGQTSEMLVKMAEFYEEEVNRATKNLSVVIEPFLMIIVGIIVGFFVISMIQPMYGMIQSL